MRMGQKKKLNPALTDPSEGKYGWLWFVGGAAAGVGLWYLLKPGVPEPKSQGLPTQVQALPPVASPSRFADLNSVAIRFDQVKTLYHGGYMLPDQALAEAGSLIAAATLYEQTDPAKASALIADLNLFIGQVQDFKSFMATNPSGIPLATQVAQPRL